MSRVYSMPKRPKVTWTYAGTPTSTPDGRYTGGYFPQDAASGTTLPAATPTDPWAQYNAMIQGAGDFGGVPAGVSMPNMRADAAKLVEAAIRQQMAANAAARKAAQDAYQKMLREYTNQYEAGIGDINEAASTDRARLNNMLSSRGISVGEKAAMNFGSLDRATQDTIGRAESQYRAAAQSAAEQTASREAELAEKDRILGENKEAQILAVQQQLEAAALDQQLKAQQIAAAQASMADRYGGGGSSDFSGMYGSDDEALAVATQSLSEILESGADIDTALRQTYIATGIDIPSMAQSGNVRARMLIDELRRQSQEAGGSDDLANRWAESGAGRVERRFGALPSPNPTPFNDMWSKLSSLFTTPFSESYKLPWYANTMRATPAWLGPISLYRAFDWATGRNRKF